MPTILDLIGIKHDSLLYDGSSLLPLMSGKKKENKNSIFLEEHNCSVKRRGVRTKNYKYVESPEKEHSVCRLCNTTHGDKISLFDLKKDPNENANIAEENKKILDEMKSELKKITIERNTMNEKRRIKTIINKKWQVK